MTISPTTPKTFTRYEVFIIAIISIMQFTVILDFMVLAPLGAMLIKELNIEPSDFGLVVSAYAFSAGASGILAAGFADKYDRKKMLLFFYVGFLAGTLFCAMAPDYNSLLLARIVTGLFAGVLGSVSLAIITDLFPMEMRGRVMGFVQMSFASSQVLGIPAGLYLANKFGWHSPFWMIVIFGVVVGVVIIMNMKPITGHLTVKKKVSAFVHLKKTLTNKEYTLAFCATTLMATGGFMIMPFASAFTTNNLGISNDSLPLLYGITGVFTIIFGPMIGKLSDRIGKFQMFLFASLLSMVTILIYTRMGASPFWVVSLINIVTFICVSGRIISSSALTTGIPAMEDRGAFMSINSAVQQTAGGIGAAIAGMIVVKTKSGLLENYDILGYVVAAAILITLGFMYLVNKEVQAKLAKQKMTESVGEAAAETPVV